MDRKDKIGIIIPVYNGEKYIEDCLGSLMNQTYENFRVYMVNDGSKDNSGALCDRYGALDPRFVVMHQENRGLSVARNRAMDRMFEDGDCRYMTCVDIDDWLDPFALEILVEAIQKEDTPLAACNFEDIEVDITGRAIMRPKAEKETISAEEAYHPQIRIMDTEDYFCDYHPIGVPVWAKLYDAQFFTDLRFPVGVIHEDVHVCHEVLFTTDGQRRKIAFVDLPLYKHVLTEGSITRSGWNKGRLKVFPGYLKGIAFTKKFGYEKAMVRQMKSYLWHLQDQKTLILSEKPVSLSGRFYAGGMWFMQKARTFQWRKPLGKKLFRRR